MSIETEECDDTLDFYDEHDRHRIEAERKLLNGQSPPATSTPSSTPEAPNPSTSSASSNARTRREQPVSDRAEADADVNQRPCRSGGGDGSTVYSRPSSSSPSSGTVVDGGFPEGGDVASMSGLFVLSGAAAGVAPRSVESSEPIYYSSSDTGSEDNSGRSGGETPTRPRLRAEVTMTRRREPCRARRQLDFSQDNYDRIVPSFWDRED